MQPARTAVALAGVGVVFVAAGLYFSLRTRSTPAGAIDAPANGTVVAATTDASGWAIDQSALGNTGVDRVQLYVDGAYIGDALYGLGRTDIGGSFGLQFAPSGWSARIDPHSLSGGPHTLEVRAHSISSGHDTSYTRTIVVPQGTAPNGSLDVPDDGTTIEATTDVRGWAIDQRANQDQGTGIDRVQLYLDGTLLADAHYGLSRPDVAASFGPQFDGSGWSAQLDPHALSPGRHTLEARARSMLSGQETLYSHQITVQQATAPRGAIDEPQVGAAVSGVQDVVGWAIDESAREGTGVSRVGLYLDGEFVGDGTYGADRPEIGEAYGARFGASGWTGQIDLTDRAAGPHTLDVRVRSALTGAETSYSRTLTVQP